MSGVVARSFWRWLRRLSDDGLWAALGMIEREGLRRGWGDYWTEGSP